MIRINANKNTKRKNTEMRNIASLLPSSLRLVPCSLLRKIIGLLTGILLSLPISVHGQCLNLDFSMADFTYWQPYTGTWPGGNVNISTSLPTFNRHTIINAATLTAFNKMDEVCDSIPKVPPGFNYSARLGNNSTLAQMEALEYTMTVDSTNSLLILHFAWVMEDPGHLPPNQPKFSMNIRDTLGNLLTGVGCVDVNFIAAQNLSNLACKTPSFVARNWTTVGFSLEAMIGQTIKIYFETRDCSQSGHFGYAYMVGECRPMAIGVMYCDGQDTAYLSAPDGFVKYKWTRTSKPGWEIEGIDSVCQDIVIDDPVDGEEFVCELSSELGLNCSSVLHAIVARTSVTADFLYGIMENGGVDIVGHDSVSWYDTCSRTATFVNLSSIKNSKTGYILWEIPDLNVVSPDSLFTYTFPPPDTVVDYLVRLTVVTENGCEDMKERYIRIYPLPFVDDSVHDILTCAGTNQTINFTGTNINPDSSLWTNSNPAIGLGLSGRGNISFTATNTDTVPLTSTITMTPKNNIRCIGENKEITIIVNPSPIMDDVDDISVCAGISQIIHFTGASINFDSSVWTNSNSAIGLDTSGRGNISFTTTNTGTIPLTATVTIMPKSDSGCFIAPKSFIITVNPLPVMDSIEDIFVCAGTNQTINFTGANINLDSSVWTNRNPAIGLGTNGRGNISFMTTNTETIPLTSTIIVIPKSDSGCIGDDKTFNITVNPLPVMDNIDDILVCAGTDQTINFTGTNINLDSSVWTNSNPAIGLDTSGRGNISFTTTNTGITPLTSTITVIPKSDSGCIEAAKTFTITVNPPPVMDSVESISVCPGINQTINFTGILVNTDSSMWTNSDSTIGLGANGRGNISFTTTNTGTTPLTSTITVIPKSNEGCIGDAKTFTITVYPEIQIHAIANDTLFCEGANIVFEVTNHRELNNIQWIGADGFSASISNPDIQNASLNNAGIYTVTAITLDNCVAVPDSLFIAILPDIQLDMEDTIFICNSGAVIYSNAINATQYLWNTGERTESIETSSVGGYWVKANNQRCWASDTTYVVEIEIPDFEIDSIGELCRDGSMELYVDIEIENLSYRWSTGDSSNRITILRNGVYGISVSYKGCTVLQNIHVECPCDFWVPNTFTPNGDGINDVFLPVPLSELNSFLMSIFDRWGNLIFQTNTLTPWDGTNKGNYAMTEVYTYIIHYSCVISPDKQQEKQGRITLMR
jgi:gliding motility-associated-like protein